MLNSDLICDIISCVTLQNLLNLSDHQYPHLQNKINNI